MVYRHQMRELLRETFCLIAKMSKTQIRPSSIVVNAEKFARTRAFVITSSAVFLLVCLVWPFTVTDYQSIIDIPFVGAGSFGDRSELASRIGEMVRAETGGEQFESIVDQIEAAGKLHSKTIEFRDYVALRDALHVGVQDNDGRLRLRLSYEGQGGDDEQELVKILAARISERLSGSVSVAEMPVSDSGSPVVMSADQRQRFDEAKWLVSQIELIWTGSLNDLMRCRCKLRSCPVLATRQLLAPAGRILGCHRAQELFLLRRLICEIQLLRLTWHH